MYAKLSALIVIALVAQQSSMAGEIFKCSGPGGSVVFSDRACGVDAKAVKVNAPQPPQAQSNSAIQDISDENEDSTCRRNANFLRQQGTAGQIQRLQTEKNNLQLQMMSANNNLAGATYMNGIRSQIAQIDASIEAERSQNSQLAMTTDAQAREALLECDKALAKRQKDRAEERKAQSASQFASGSDTTAQILEQARKDREAKAQHEYEVQAAKLAKEQQQRQD